MKQILLADDQEPIRVSYKSTFLFQGIKTRFIEVSTGSGLIEAVKKESIDLIISDNYMDDDITGLDALKQLRAEGHKIPFYLSTGNLLREEAMSAGATGYIQKPSIYQGITEIIKKHF